MSIAEKLTTIAENEQKVYDAGYGKGYLEGNEVGYETGIEVQKEVSVDWDVIQDYGNRTAYDRGFAAWGAEEINPKYMIAPTTTRFTAAFQACTKLKKVDWKKFDLTKGTTFNKTFNSCFELESIKTDLIPVSLAANCWEYTFSGCWALKMIQKIKAFAGHTWQYAFNRCDELEEIRFTEDSEIANDISFADSPKLSRESIISICKALANVQGKTCTFSTSVDLEMKLKEIIFGFGVGSFADGETKTMGGITFTLNGDEIFVNGTAENNPHYNILNEPITIQTGYGGVFADLIDANGIFTSHLKMVVSRDGAEPEIIDGATGIYLADGDVIQSVDLVIFDGESWDNMSCKPLLQFDHKPTLIDHNTLGAANWTIIY